MANIGLKEKLFRIGMVVGGLGAGACSSGPTKAVKDIPPALTGVPRPLPEPTADLVIEPTAVKPEATKTPSVTATNQAETTPTSEIIKKMLKGTDLLTLEIPGVGGPTGKVSEWTKNLTEKAGKDLNSLNFDEQQSWKALGALRYSEASGQTLKLGVMEIGVTGVVTATDGVNLRNAPNGEIIFNAGLGPKENFTELGVTEMAGGRPWAFGVGTSVDGVERMGFAAADLIKGAEGAPVLDSSLVDAITRTMQLNGGTELVNLKEVTFPIIKKTKEQIAEIVNKTKDIPYAKPLLSFNKDTIPAKLIQAGVIPEKVVYVGLDEDGSGRKTILRAPYLNTDTGYYGPFRSKEGDISLITGVFEGWVPNPIGGKDDYYLLIKSPDIKGEIPFEVIVHPDWDATVPTNPGSKFGLYNLKTGEYTNNSDRSLFSSRSLLGQLEQGDTLVVGTLRVKKDQYFVLHDDQNVPWLTQIAGFRIE